MALLNDGVSTQIDLDGLVNGVVTKLERRLNKPGIFILASPGCSRGRLVTVLLRRGLVDAVYAYGGFGSKVGDDVRGRVIEFSSVDELVGKLGSVNGRVAVVVRSTTDAVRLRDRLGNAEVIYLPKYYEDAAKEVLSGGVPGVAGVRHEGLGEGVSPSMLREGVPSEVGELIRKLSPGRLGLRDSVRDFLKKAPMDVAALAIIAGLLILLGAGVAGSLAGLLVGKFLESVVGKWRRDRDEVLGGFVRLVGVAREVRNYLGDERFEAVVDEVVYEWGLSIEEFTNTITNIANIAERKQLTEEDIKKIINNQLESIEKELNNVKDGVKGLLVGAKVFFIDDIESGLLYGNFKVKDGIPKIATLLGTAKNELVTDLVDVGRFREVAEGVFSRLVRDGRVVLIGPRGIGKSTLATYVTWRSLLGGLSNVVLNEPMDAVIRIESLRPGDAAKLNNLVEAAGRRFVVIYDPSPVEAYYKPETMQRAKHDIESVENTLRELMEVRNAWVVIILPRELYEQVQRAGEGGVVLRRVLDNLERDVVMVNLRDGEFLREVIRRYSGCDNVSESLVGRIVNFDPYTLVAKYAGIWLRESGCEVEDVDKALRESTGEPKLFFAHYIWSTVLRGNEDLAKRVSVPLILHATLGPIPEGFTYITKAVYDDGAWKLIDRDYLAKSKLEGLRKAYLEPIAKWLSTRHEDLIEETLEELVGLRGEEARNNYRNHGFGGLIETLDWGFKKALEEVGGLSRAVKPEEARTNLLIFVSERLKHALKPYTNCWKRAAFIIGYALTGRPIVPRPEDLREDLRKNVAESLGDALRGCGVDDYLLVGNEIPPLIQHLTYTRVSTEAFIDRYDEAVAEVNRILSIARDRGYIYDSEEFYGLGLASIIANAAGSGKPVGPSDADAALHIAPFTIQRVVFPNLIRPVLGALEPLRDKAPHRYLELLTPASSIENLNRDTVRYVFNELNDILSNYGDVVKGHPQSLVHAIRAYDRLLRRHRKYFDDKEVEGMVYKIVGLLNELGRFKSGLGVIAWAYALAPALVDEDVRGLMEKKLDIDVVNKTNEVLKELNKMREQEKVKELMRNEEFMSYVESMSIKAGEEAVKGVILSTASFLKHELAHYRLNNDELKEAARLFNEAAGEYREIGNYRDYLIDRGWALRAEAIEGSLVGGKLVDGFRQLYEETFNEKHFEPTAPYLSIASFTLGEYLVPLALTGGDERVKKIKELLDEHLWVLNADYEVSVLTRLMLNALLGPKDRLDNELRGGLVVGPRELIEAFKYEINSELLPALRVAFGLVKPEDVGGGCESGDSIKKGICTDAVSAAKGDGAAVERLRWKLIDGLRGQLIKKLGLFKGLGVNVDDLFDEFMELVVGLDGESLVQLIAPGTSMAQLAFMLYALINGDEKLAKAHALRGAVDFGEKLLTRLFLEAYRACCDLGSEEFRRAIAKLFLYHV